MADITCQLSGQGVPCRQALPRTTRRPGLRSPWGMALQQLSTNRAAMAGLGLLLAFAALAALAPVLSFYDPLTQDYAEVLRPPSAQHWLGTDLLGRDILSRLLHGGRLTLVIALVAVAMSGSIGVVLGLVSGYYGGKLDTVLMRFIDMLLAFPRILLALCMVTIMGTGPGNVMVAVGISGISGYARLVRGTVLAAKQQPYVDAARAVGCRSRRIMFRHVLPNVLAPIIVLATLDMAGAILSASSLSFLGLGAQPPQPEWGLMLNEGRAYLHEAPWITMAPGFAIMLTVLSINMLGDGLRDALDPRLRA
mgnify:CR=1 FL=1